MEADASTKDACAHSGDPCDIDLGRVVRRKAVGRTEELRHIDMEK